MRSRCARLRGEPITEHDRARSLRRRGRGRLAVALGVPAIGGDLRHGGAVRRSLRCRNEAQDADGEPVTRDGRDYYRFVFPTIADSAGRLHLTVALVGLLSLGYYLAPSMDLQADLAGILLGALVALIGMAIIVLGPRK